MDEPNTGAPAGAEETQSGAQDQEETITMTAKELQAKLDSEADKRSAKALETAQAKWDAAKQQEIEDAKSEGAKLAKMTAAEKAAAEEKAQTEKLNQREAELNKRELTANVKDILVEKNLPLDIADSLVGLGDAEKIKSTVTSLNTYIDKEVNKRVSQAMQSEPPKNGASALDASDDPFKSKLNKYK